LLEDLRALVEFARAGSIAGAADRLFRTPSAITRQVQRLEAELGAELLDRSVKPPRLNSLSSSCCLSTRARRRLLPPLAR
jgi:DNA-binding transcriptional LysR family regulator